MFLLLGLFLLPLALAGGNAWASKNSLERAVEALASGDISTARSDAADALEDAQDMRGATEGLYGFVWGLLPTGEQSRRDVSVLSDALVDLTSAVKVAADVYPSDRAEQGFLIDDKGHIDVEALQAEVNEFETMQSYVVSAARNVGKIDGSAPLLGPVLIRTARSLDKRLASAVEGLELVEPLAPVLPRLLGGDGKQRMLFALLNPAEQRFSGGAALSFLPVSIQQGQVQQGSSLIGSEDGSDAFAKIRWKPVPQNSFHPPGFLLRLSTASLAPSWSVSGEEQLRAWEGLQGGQSFDGLFAIDVIALQDLMRFTGPIVIPALGTLDENNLTEKLVGSYEAYTGPEVFRARRAGTETLLGEFLTKLMSSSDPLGVLRSLVASGQGRHLAVYSRDPDIQSAMRAAELEGDLSDTPNDYLGVFNQALKGLKSDYWQRRTISQEVTLRSDGSAGVTVTIDVFNDSPPPAEGVDKAYSPYVRRDNDMGLGVFLPIGAQGIRIVRDGNPLFTDRRSFRGRPYVNIRLKLKPQESRSVSVAYDVPNAARTRDRELEYRLDVDPHGLVVPQRYSVSVRWPSRLSPENLPEGWTSGPRSASYTTNQLTTAREWRINLR